MRPVALIFAANRDLGIIRVMSDKLEMPPVVDCVVELGVVRMRMGVGATARQSYRPRMCLWVDQRTGMILHFELTEPLESYVPLVVNSLGGLAERIGSVPRQVQLRDPQLASELRRILEPIASRSWCVNHSPCSMRPSQA